MEAVKLRREGGGGGGIFCGFEIEGRETHIVLSIGAEGIETHNFLGVVAEGNETNMMFGYLGGRGGVMQREGNLNNFVCLAEQNKTEGNKISIFFGYWGGAVFVGFEV